MSDTNNTFLKELSLREGGELPLIFYLAQITRILNDLEKGRRYEGSANKQTDFAKPAFRQGTFLIYTDALHPPAPSLTPYIQRSQSFSPASQHFCTAVCQNKSCASCFSSRRCLNSARLVHRPRTVPLVPLVSPAPEQSSPSLSAQRALPGACVLTQRDPANLLLLADPLPSRMNGPLKPCWRLGLTLCSLGALAEGKCLLQLRWEPQHHPPREGVKS